MSSDSLELIAPNGLDIVGARKTDNTIMPFTANYVKGDWVYRFSQSLTDLEKRNGSNILVDSNGGEWSPYDVQNHTLKVSR